jgi:hypothetical protein
MNAHDRDLDLEHDLDRAVRFFWMALLAKEHGEEKFLARAQCGLLNITRRNPPGFAEAIIDATAARLVAAMPHVPLARARHQIGIDACRLVPEIQWLDWSLVPPKGSG